MTSAQPYINKGSGTVISGLPSFVSLLEETISVYGSSLEKAVQDTIEQETTIFKEQLSKHPDWADKVDDGEVTVSEGHLNYAVNHPDALDLEYGNPIKKVVATGTLRSIAKRREYDVNQSLMRHLSNRLPNA
jgi:hypothetical protein